MAGPKQPINLVVSNGKKHLTKAEIKERKASEVKAYADKIKHPAYLPKDLRKEFKDITDELVRIEIMSNLDVDALARYLISRKEWLKIANIMDESSPIYMIDGVSSINEQYIELSKVMDRFFKQCRSAASDLGLTISSRCKLVVPKKEDDVPKNKFSKFAK
jgi:P27 family predicted phage terminase small subunit